MQFDHNYFNFTLLLQWIVSQEIVDDEKFKLLAKILGCNHLELTPPRNARFADLILMDAVVLSGLFPEGFL